MTVPIERKRVRIVRRAALAIVLVALVGSCATDAPESPRATASIASPGARDTPVPTDVEARLARLKAELAITPLFCSLENRPCRAQNRGLVDRGIEMLLARCTPSRRSFERCLTKEATGVADELRPATPAGAPSTR